MFEIVKGGMESIKQRTKGKRTRFEKYRPSSF